MRSPDTLLFARIRQWETERFAALPPPEQQAYLAGLQSALATKQAERERVVVQERNKNRLAAYAGDIQQLGWRLEYLGGSRPRTN